MPSDSRGPVVGLVYDLREDYLREGYTEEETAEFDRPDTVAAIEGALVELGDAPARIGHARELVSRLARGERWDIVFNIAEGMHGIGREAQAPAILDLYRIPYTFSDPVTLALTLHKAFAKAVMRDAGIPTPDYAVLTRAEDARGVALEPPLFAKPLAEGTGKGVSAASRIESLEALEAVAADLIERFRQPVLVEKFLPGRELTVGVLGSGSEAEAIGCLEVLAGDVYSYDSKERCEELVEYRLAEDALAVEACRLAVATWRALECRDGGRVDLRADDKGRMNVMEVNPLAGLHPEHSDLPILCAKTGMTYAGLIDRIMRSALARHGLRPPE